MRTSLLAGLLLCTGACAHAPMQHSNAALVSSLSQEETSSVDSCVRSDDDPGSFSPCPVQGAPTGQEITRMTQLLQSQNEMVSTADAAPSHLQQQDIDDIEPPPASVAEDMP